MGEKGCDVKPKGDDVHLQMKRAHSGHWFLPVGEYQETMAKLCHGHVATVSSTPTISSLYTSVAE